MNAVDLKIINKMYEAITAMSIVVEEVTSFNCHGRKAMTKSLGELSDMMDELNKPPALITAELVKRLREHTGEGLMASKKALVRSNGNFNDAVEYLRTSGNINNFCTDQNRPALGQRHN